MRIEKRTLNWMPKASAWQHQQQLNAKRRAMAEYGLATTTALATGLFSAKATEAEGQAQLAANAAMARIRKIV